MKAKKIKKKRNSKSIDLLNNCNLNLSDKDRELQLKYDKLKKEGKLNSDLQQITEPKVVNRKPIIEQNGLRFFCSNTIKESRREGIIRKLLTFHKVYFKQEVSFIDLKYWNGHYPRFDFYLPKLGLVIEYDGSHHEKEQNKAKDFYKDKWLKANGIKCARFPYDLYPNDKQLIDAIERLIFSRKSMK